MARRKATAGVTRETVEDFLFAEAAILDEWRLEEWIDLFAEDGEYHVPSTDNPQGSPSESLYLVYDDRHRLAERARRLLKRTAHAEYPHSTTRRLVTNVRVVERSAQAVRVTCNFVAYRSKEERTDVFPGHAEYELRVGEDGTLRILKKRVVVDAETLRAQGKLSIIL